MIWHSILYFIVSRQNWESSNQQLRKFLHRLTCDDLAVMNGGTKITSSDVMGSFFRSCHVWVKLNQSAQMKSDSHSNMFVFVNTNVNEHWVLSNNVNITY